MPHRGEKGRDLVSSTTEIAAVALAVAALAVLFLSGIETIRVVAAAVGLAIAVAASVVPMVRALRFAPIAALLGHALACAATGGLESPLLPAVAAMAAAPLLAATERIVHLVAAVCFVAAIALLPTEVRGETVAAPYHAILALLSIGWAIAIVAETAKRVAAAQERAARAMDRLRDERVQEALAQARRLQSVGAKVAHELKNPLAAIKGLVQLLGRGQSDDRSAERINVLKSEIDRMEIILKEYLSYSRPLEDLEPAPVKLASIASDVVAVLSARAETGGVRLECSGDAPPVEADRRRLKEALINLVSNALEATPRGGRVAVIVAPADEGATLDVVDSGAGISEADMAKLGQSYFTTREGGTGLGFVLAKSAVSQHGGTLEVSSKVGVGTTIRVRLPEKQPKREEMPAHG